ncbi:MAG: iron-containing alcohol dehydrogenase [Caulobacterales bacterium]|nr:iron-containing alcohol dehydrogenase [Caulobacterales bacterium]
MLTRDLVGSYRELASATPTARVRLTVGGAQVSLGAGAVEEVSGAVRALGAGRVLGVSTRSGRRRYAAVFDALGDGLAGVFDDAQPHCPHAAVEACRTLYKGLGADGVVTIGGGSTTGLGKILSAEEGAAFVCVPTTYAGSEMTSIYGRRIEGEKRTVKEPAARPGWVIYDPDLTVSLPARESAITGMNSLAHAVEALYPQTPDPLAFEAARLALALHRDALPRVIGARPDPAARARALTAAHLGGVLVETAGIALHHKICHVLGGLFGMPHGDSNSVMLPFVTNYNAPFATEAARAVSQVFADANPGGALHDFSRSLGNPTGLAQLGLDEGDLERVAEITLSKPGWNPRPLDRGGLTAMLAAAYAGERPAPPSI